jgi:predicted ATP-grasp superfamily ATP-dependent carboligase
MYCIQVNTKQTTSTTAIRKSVNQRLTENNSIYSILNKLNLGNKILEVF